MDSRIKWCIIIHVNNENKQCGTVVCNINNVVSNYRGENIRFMGWNISVGFKKFLQSERLCVIYSCTVKLLYNGIARD